VSDIQTPLEPAKTTSHRLMLAVVIVLGALIVIALILLVVGMMRKFSDHPAPPQAAGIAAPGAFVLPAGAKVIEMQSESGRLILHVRAGDSDEIDIIDTEDGHLISQIKAAK